MYCKITAESAGERILKNRSTFGEDGQHYCLLFCFTHGLYSVIQKTPIAIGCKFVKHSQILIIFANIMGFIYHITLYIYATRENKKKCNHGAHNSVASEVLAKRNRIHYLWPTLWKYCAPRSCITLTVCTLTWAEEWQKKNAEYGKGWSNESGSWRHDAGKHTQNDELAVAFVCFWTSFALRNTIVLFSVNVFDVATV